MSDTGADAFRWQSFFQHAAQPLFLLNRRRRILFVNRAWETCTGLPLAQVRGRVCRRRSAAAGLEADEMTLSACAPPPDALEGRTCQVRRRVPGSPTWWEIEFVPLARDADLLGILGVVRVLAAPAQTPAPVPEKLMALRDRLAARHRLDDLDADAPAMRRVLEQARLAARTRLPITLLGEAGAGKQWLARAIHLAGEHRQHFFACLDAERLPASLLEGTLFGSPPRFGAIYLRDADRLPTELQSRLADIVEAGEDAEFPRLMVGLRRDPHTQIQAGKLLERFYCAASPITIVVPPLRERRGEFSKWIDVFLRRAGASLGISDEATTALRGHAWPGNLCELQEVLSDVCRHVKGKCIELADLPFYLKQGPLPAERRLPLDPLLEQVERRLIALALRLAQNNQTRAAELLEIWRPRLMRRMEKFGFKSDETPA